MPASTATASVPRDNARRRPDAGSRRATRRGGAFSWVALVRVALSALLLATAAVSGVLGSQFVDSAHAATASASNSRMRISVSATPDTLPAGGGKVRFTYTIENVTDAPLYWKFVDYAPATITSSSCALDPATGNWTKAPNFVNTYFVARRSTVTMTCDATVTGPTTETFRIQGMWYDDIQTWPRNKTSLEVSTPVNVATPPPSPYRCDEPTVFGSWSPSVPGPTVLGRLKPGMAGFETVGPTSTWSYNALAHRDLGDGTGFFYAISNNDNQAEGQRLLQIDGTGTIRDLGAITGFAASDLANAANTRKAHTGGLSTGFFDDAGTYWVSNGSNGTGTLYRVDLATRVATKLPNQSAFPKVIDYTYAHGYAWGITTQNGPKGGNAMVRVHLGTGKIDYFDLAGLGLPPGSYGAAWTYGNGDLAFGLNEAQPGGAQVRRIAVTNPASPTFSLVASSAGPSGANIDGTACAGPSTDVALTTTRTSPASATAGSPVSWDVTATNTGAGVSSGLLVSATLPAGFMNATATMTTSAGTCRIEGTTVTCLTTERIAVGERRTVTITAGAPSIAERRCYTTTARVTPHDNDPAVANNTATSAEVCVEPLVAAVDLATTGVGVAAAGDGSYTATYTVTATNTGTAPGTYGPITDTPQFSDAIEVTGARWTGARTGSSAGSGPFVLGGERTLAPGATDTYTVAVSFRLRGDAAPSACSGAAGAGLHHAVTAPGETGSAGNNTACLAPPSFAVQASVDGTGPIGAPVTVGVDGTATLDHVVTVTNTGTVALPAPPVATTVRVPAGFTLQAITLTPGVAAAPGEASTSPAHTDGAVIVPAGTSDLAPGAVTHWTIRLDLVVADAAAVDWAAAGRCDSGGDATTGVRTVVALPGDADGPANNVACTPLVPAALEVTVEMLGTTCDATVATCGLRGADFAILASDPAAGGPAAAPLTPAAVTDGYRFTFSGLLPGQDYWLVETRAPSGHTLLAAPVGFTVTTAGIQLADGAAAHITVTGEKNTTIAIVAVTAGALPEAGGSGVLPYAVLGTVLVGSAALLALRRPRHATG